MLACSTWPTEGKFCAAAGCAADIGTGPLVDRVDGGARLQIVELYLSLSVKMSKLAGTGSP